VLLDFRKAGCKYEVFWWCPEFAVLLQVGQYTCIIYEQINLSLTLKMLEYMKLPEGHQYGRGLFEDDVQQFFRVCPSCRADVDRIIRKKDRPGSFIRRVRKEGPNARC
jgi:hypothetical protein